MLPCFKDVAKSADESPSQHQRASQLPSGMQAAAVVVASFDATAPGKWECNWRYMLNRSPTESRLNTKRTVDGQWMQNSASQRRCWSHSWIVWPCLFGNWVCETNIQIKNIKIVCLCDWLRDVHSYLKNAKLQSSHLILFFANCSFLPYCFPTCLFLMSSSSPTTLANIESLSIACTMFTLYMPLEIAPLCRS